MFGRHFEGRFDQECAPGRRGRHRHHGFGGRNGFGRHGGDDEMMHAGRMLAQGDLRLIALALIEEQPRHGYDIIKALEEKTAEWYSPSPGIVYPTLTYLEETGYLTSQPEGAKKLYTITEEGRTHLAQNRDLVEAVLKRLAFIGERAQRIRERMGEDRTDERRNMPNLVRAALNNLRDVAAQRIGDDPAAEAKVVEILARAAGELKRPQ